MVALIGCQHDTSPPAQPVSNSVAVQAEQRDSRCSDEALGTLHTTDPGYLISADELVARTMRDHLGEFRTCLLHRRREQFDIGGKVVVKIHIDAAGKPAQVETRGLDAELDHCICGEVLKLTFALTSSTVSYPMFFGAN